MYLRVIVLVDAIVVDAALVAQRDGALARARLGLAHEEAAVDAGREQVLGRVARDGPVVPRVLLQRVDGRHVVARHPAHAARQRVRLAPLAALVVAHYAHLLACNAHTTPHH